MENTANVQYTSENASRKINSVTAINKEGKSDPLAVPGEQPAHVWATEQGQTYKCSRTNADT